MLLEPSNGGPPLEISIGGFSLAGAGGAIFLNWLVESKSEIRLSSGAAFSSPILFSLAIFL